MDVSVLYSRCCSTFFFVIRKFVENVNVLCVLNEC